MGLRRRFVVLSALTWASVGFLIPLASVFMLARGLTLGELGVVVAVQPLVVLVLELPTGGLADVLGRRPVLLAAGVIDVAAIAVFLGAHGPGLFAVAWGLKGVSRALESGPLEAWYVDAALAEDEAADIEGGLAAASTGLGLALAAGALATAGLVRVSLGDLDPLVLPVIAALIVRLIDLGAVATLVDEERRHPRKGALRAATRGAPVVVRTTVRIIRTVPALLALVAVELLWGAGLSGVEILIGPRLADLLGSGAQGVTALGVSAAVGWGLSAFGSSQAARITRWAGSPARAGAALRLAQGGATLVMALVAGPAGVITGYLAFYVVHGPSNVVHYGMVHRKTAAEHRTTMISANSLASQLGGGIASLGMGALAAAAGIPWAWALSAVLLAAAAPLYRIAGREPGEA